VLAIYARETGQGMALPEDTGAPGPDPATTVRDDDSPPDDGGDEPPAPKRGAHLRIVK
jgi:stringent starvation protein B